MTTTEVQAIGEALPCSQFIEFLDDYLVGQLTSKEQEIFAAHLAICTDCWSYLESYKTTTAIARSFGIKSAPSSLPDLPPELIEAILAAKGNRHS